MAGAPQPEPFVWQPDAALIRASNLGRFIEQHGLDSYDALLRRADADPAWFWSAVLSFFHIEFARPYVSVMDLSAGVEWPQWCVGGTTNIVLNCLDRHRGTPVWNKRAVIGEAENGSSSSWTYAELEREVRRLALLLKSRGVAKGDVVALYLPMIPEAAAAFFAVVKIGAVVLPLFSGFGPQPIVERLEHSEAKAVIVADLSYRKGTPVRMKEVLDRALERSPGVRTVVVLQREGRGGACAGRDVAWLCGSPEDPGECATEIVEAEAAAMLMYTSGTTGEPKGTIHTHCGMLAKNALDMGLCVDVQAQDTVLWMSDMGWIVGPKIILSATLLSATMVMVEGVPDWPRADRLWEIVAKHGITILGTVPTAVRQMMRHGSDIVSRHDLSRLRLTVTAGEPWTEEAWLWFFEHVCRRRAPILNYAGGTECGGAILIGSLLRPLRPCSFGGPVPGGGADIVNAEGRSLPPGQTGELVLRRPSMGRTRGLWKAPERYIESYWKIIPGAWVQGDLASRDEAGLWYLHGRSDDVIKIAGKRTGPAELESAVMATGLVTDVAVVGVPDALTGSALVCVCVPRSGALPASARADIGDTIAAEWGAPYRPKEVIFVPDLPRTRNQKIMRRLVRAVITDSQLGDTSALANPEAIDAIREAILNRYSDRTHPSQPKHATGGDA
jgi:acetyl-CoA synthetase